MSQAGQGFKHHVLVGTGQWGRVFVTIEWRSDGRLSIAGVEGPMSSGDCKGGCGQIREALDNIKRFNIEAGWDQAKVGKLREVWERWHLNDMRAGCEHQRAEGWRSCQGYHTGKAVEEWDESGMPLYRVKGYRVTYRNCAGVEENVWRKDWYQSEGMQQYNQVRCSLDKLSKPCPVCGYKYGSAWLREEVPGEVVEWLRGLPVDDGLPACWAR